MRLRNQFLLLFLGCVLLAGCNPSESPPNVPSDFLLLLDAHSAISSENAPGQNVFIEISADGKVEFERYDHRGAIVYDENHMITYTSDQVLDAGKFTLESNQLENLWETIEENNFFELNDDYRMSIGLSYAFIKVEANGRSHVVDNIGLELLEIRTIVELVNSFLPENTAIVYRDGVFP